MKGNDNGSNKFGIPTGKVRAAGKKFTSPQTRDEEVKKVEREVEIPNGKVKKMVEAINKQIEEAESALKEAQGRKQAKGNKTAKSGVDQYSEEVQKSEKALSDLKIKKAPLQAQIRLKMQKRKEQAARKKDQEKTANEKAKKARSTNELEISRVEAQVRVDKKNAEKPIKLSQQEKIILEANEKATSTAAHLSTINGKVDEPLKQKLEAHLKEFVKNSGFNHKIYSSEEISKLMKYKAISHLAFLTVDPSTTAEMSASALVHLAMPTSLPIMVKSTLV